MLLLSQLGPLQIRVTLSPVYSSYLNVPDALRMGSALDCIPSISPLHLPLRDAKVLRSGFLRFRRISRKNSGILPRRQ